MNAPPRRSLAPPRCRKDRKPTRRYRGRSRRSRVPGDRDV